MNNAGQLYFGVNLNGVQTLNTTKTGGYRDGQWHHVVASLGAGGMRLYVDGALAATRADVIKGQSYEGVWRIGGDNNASWPSRSTSDYFAGTIDEVAVYPRVLSAAQVASHYTGATAGNSLPTAAFTLRRLGLAGHLQRFRVLGHRRHHRVVRVDLRRRRHGHRCDAEPLLRGGR